MAMNLHKVDNVNRLHSKVIDTIPYISKLELLTIKTINIMENPINITLDIYNACRNNTAMAATNDGHYDFESLAKISGARFEHVLEELQWCAENHHRKG